jgi:hypothetical protein
MKRIKCETSVMDGIYFFFRSVYRKTIPKNTREVIWRVKKFLRRTIFKGIYFETSELRHDFLKYYNSAKLLPYDYPKTVIYMADGRCIVGGLSDRLRGIVSVYKLCKRLNLAFKINFTIPFKLNEYLQPGNYDWYILPDAICYNKKQARPCFVFDYGNYPYNIKQQAFWAKRFFKENYKQIHIYTNMLIAEKEYAMLFSELFKPVPELETLIDYNVSLLGGKNKFTSVAFRFLQLLGDFRENGDTPVLPVAERKILINKCMKHLKEIYNENDGAKVLVTSDSVSFLEEAKKLSFVYVIPGGVRHIDTCHDTGKDVNLKLFLDYFVLSRSKKIYLVIEDQMYNSGFSYRSALLNNVPFIVKKY